MPECRLFCIGVHPSKCHAVSKIVGSPLFTREHEVRVGFINYFAVIFTRDHEVHCGF